MNANELISSTILSDVIIIADIYKIIKEAALDTTGDERVTSSSNDVCLLPLYTKDVSRFSRCMDNRGGHSITYDANDITIVGGAVLNIYDYKLGALKERRDLKALDTYIKKKTSDIDIVWWPRPSTNKEVITSKSEAIIKLTTVFREKLQKNFKTSTKMLEAKIKKYISNATNKDELYIDVGLDQTRPAGVFNITINFHIKDKLLKMCDIIVHDSGASQRYDADGNEIKIIQFMTDDPVFCSPLPGSLNSITYITVNGTQIGVSNVNAFVNQQMLAFDNLIRVKNPKSLINYKRVEFIKILLKSFILNSEHNTSNYTELFEVFGTRDHTYPTYIISEINKRVNSSVLKLYGTILELCETIDKEADPIINKLCADARIANDINNLPSNQVGLAERFASSEQVRLQELKERVGKLKRAASEMGRKKEAQLCAAIYNSLDNKRLIIQRMLPSELLEYKAEYISELNAEIQKINSIAAEQEAIIEKERVARARQQEQAAAAAAARSMPRPAAPVENRRYREPARPFMSAEPPRVYLPPDFYGYAPAYAPPQYIQPYYIEMPSRRPIQWQREDHYWYYIHPSFIQGPLLPLPGQPPLPPGQPPLPPGKPPQQYHRRRGGKIQTRKNTNCNNKTMKRY